MRTRFAVAIVLATSVFLEPALAEDVVFGELLAVENPDDEPRWHHWINELAYLAPDGGAPTVGAETGHEPWGWFSIPLEPLPQEARRPGLMATVFSLRYDGDVAFTVNRFFGFRANRREQPLRIYTPAHYNVMYDRHPKEWGDKPAINGSDFYQTFVARTPHITRIATKLADKSGDHYHLTLNYAVYEPNDGPPSTWKRISPVRSRFLSGGTDPIIHVFAVRYRSNEMTLTPGKTYAIRLWRDPASQSETFALVARADDGKGYRDGILYRGDEPHSELDAYAYISGGEEGTITNHAPVGDVDQKKFIGGAKSFGQTFTATGVKLAAVDIIYATGPARPASLPVRFQLYDKPGGQPIGHSRICYGVPRSFQARAAVQWMYPEAPPLEPGKTYYLEWTSPGCNTWQLNEDLPGHAWRDGKPVEDADLAMSIVEYLPRPRPRTTGAE